MPPAGRNRIPLTRQVTSYRLFQVDLENRIKIGKISSLPASMSNIKTILEKLLNPEKLQVGPTDSKPGPILLKHAITADKLVVMENPSTEIKIKLKSVIMA